MTKVPNFESKYEPTDAERAALNKQAQRRRVKPVAPRFDEAGPGDANRATTEVPKSELKNKFTDAGRAAPNGQAQRRRVKPIAPQEARSGDAARATSEVPNSEPKCNSTDAGRLALNGQAQRWKEPTVEPRLGEAGPGDGKRAVAEDPKYESTDGKRSALDRQEQRQKEQPVAPGLNEAGPGDADRTEDSKYEQTDVERAALDRQAQRQKEQPPAPRFSLVADDRGFRIVLNHPDANVAHSLAKEALATASDDFFEGLLDQLCGLANIDESYDKISERKLNFLFSTIIDGKPKDAAHSLHLFHMVAGSTVLVQTLQNYSRLQNRISSMDRDLCDISPFLIEKTTALIKELTQLQESDARSINQFARTYCKQLEASERYRRSGEPSATVHVAPGGQAIVGNVTHAPPQTAPNNPTAAPRALTNQQHSAVTIIGEPDRVPVPVRRRKTPNDQ
jgi:hypothetical protein